MINNENKDLLKYFSDKRFYSLPDIKANTYFIGNMFNTDFNLGNNLDTLELSLEIIKGSSSVFIYSVFTNGKYRGRGYAREFVEGVLDLAKNEGFRSVSLLSKDCNSDSFWRHMGFEHRGDRKYERNVNE